jgi:hypothetical protein
MKTDSLDANLSIAVAFWHLLKCDRGVESILHSARVLHPVPGWLPWQGKAIFSCEVGGDTRQGDVDRLTDAGSKQQGPLRTTLQLYQLSSQHNIIKASSN